MTARMTARQIRQAMRRIRIQAVQGLDQDEIGPVMPQIEAIYREALRLARDVEKKAARKASRTRRKESP